MCRLPDAASRSDHDSQRRLERVLEVAQEAAAVAPSSKVAVASSSSDQDRDLSEHQGAATAHKRHRQVGRGPDPFRAWSSRQPRSDRRPKAPRESIRKVAPIAVNQKGCRRFLVCVAKATSRSVRLPG